MFVGGVRLEVWVLFLSCVCVGGVVFCSCVCVCACACDLLIFFKASNEHVVAR